MSFITAGTYVFRLTAYDGINPPVFDTVTLTVVNPPPVVNAGADQTVQLPGSASLDGTVTDDGLTLLTTTWSVLSGPGTVTFGNPNSVDTTATFSAAGTYVLRLTANDTVNTVSDDVTIVVTPATLLYFSTLGDVNVGGLGSADDADVYAWFGGTTYSRVFDASANGVPAQRTSTHSSSWTATPSTSPSWRRRRCPAWGRSRRRTSSGSMPARGPCSSTAPTSA